MYSERVPRNLLFVRGVGREELREDPNGRGERQLLALHVCRRIRRVIDGRAETKMRALFGDILGSDVYLRVRTLSSGPRRSA